MSDIKVGDAVRTPRGSVARVCAIEQNGVAVLEQLDLPDAEGALYKSKLTRLVPDTGLEERAQKLADRFDADPYLPRWPCEALRALLDAEQKGEPQPSAQVTRDYVFHAIAACAEAAADNLRDPRSRSAFREMRYQASRIRNRLLAKEEGE